FAITSGQFTMIDAIFHCPREIGPTGVSVWTWTIAEYEIEAMVGLMARRRDHLGPLGDWREQLESRDAWVKLGCCRRPRDEYARLAPFEPSNVDVSPHDSHPAYRRGKRTG